MEGFDVWKIAEMLFGILAVVFAAYLAKARVTLGHVADLITLVNKSLEDNVLTQDEMKAIVASMMRILGREAEVKK